MKSRALIGLMADGQVHSGESLASRLGISRTAIWKQVKRAADEGYEIETIRGKGYRLVTPVDLLDSAMILEGIPESVRRRVKLAVLDEVDSTNAEIIRQRPASGSSVIPVCIADHQTAGRGRRGREWQSPRGQNLYLSLGLTFHGGFAMLDGLSLVLGVATAEALEAMGSGQVGLKWPNDIFLGRGKVAGILVELQGELEEGIIQVVAGIGLNVHMKQAESVTQAWDSLSVASPEVDWARNDLAASLVGSLVDAADEFSENGFAAFRERWQQRDIFSGKSLVASQGNLAGVGAGIDGSGNYMLDTDDGVTAVRAGEISLRVQL
ncbi:biotin--[acetyl-CoA-carboxylase] ligase [Marinobacter sp. NP-4(2019)]|uniref:biotin--[acetyl-CoA-carboxylase] ligase n=1 Tax=Marinobacter sp. NP-4(2019) TaxID=2488665 RepID=UPI000FC3CF47|nr:biotin--[acetyl-CoA-carboxylase] ligase [Marinobacter sp. NP-4(2019)]AZT82749.1 biotin--[acetyl-CoA-carboxylase] ligase [Marinobacter sp. NP-4(2019)]